MDSEPGWELGRKSKRKEERNKARARDYRYTEGESSASSSDDPTRVRRRGYDSQRRADKKTKTRGRDRLVATSSDSESECDVRGSDRHRVDSDGVRAGKILRSWNLKFNGKATKKAAEEFLHQLSDCREGNQLSDAGMLGALPCVFAGEAATWFRLEKARISTWKAFVKAFKRRFIGEYDRQDLLDDLRRRTQGKGESVESYMENFRLIVSHFKRPPSEESQVDRAYRNLLPEYRRAMMDEVVETLDDIVKYGRRFERRKEIDGRYVPPPPPEKMYIQSAAFTGPPSAAKARVAAAGEGSAPAETAKPKRAGKKRDEKGSASDASVSAAEVMGVQQVPAKTSAVRNGQTYAEATRGNGRGGGNANAPGTVPPARQPEGANYRENRQAYVPRAQGSQNVRSEQQNRPECRKNAESPKRNESGAKRPFVGPCFTCQGVGHRASECPYVVCFWCRQRGHVARECPQRANLSCNKCGAPGVTVLTCARCAPLMPLPENTKGAGSK